MPGKIVTGISTWWSEIEIALVFWFIGATIGIGQHLLSPDSFSWRVVFGRALSTGGLAAVSALAAHTHTDTDTDRASGRCCAA